MISVIIPAHNYGKYILECLNSILNNNNSLINEIIIINDSSIDETDLILKDYPKKNNKIKYYNKSFRSLSKSLNFGITQASANLITKVDADDWVEKNFLEVYYNTLKKNITTALDELTTQYQCKQCEQFCSYGNNKL